MALADNPDEECRPSWTHWTPGFIEAYGLIAKDLIRSSAEIVVGTDAGIAPFKPHDVLPVAVAQLAAGGMSPEASLATVTSVAARACGIAARKGRIAVGMDADLLVLGGNPLENLTRLHDVRAVFRAGVSVVMS